MSLAGFLDRMTDVFERADIEYMIVGSLASALHGEARTTRDVDIVIALDRGRLDLLLACLPADTFYADPDAARDALRRHGQFNVIDMETGWKADLIVRKPSPHGQAEFERRERAVLLGRPRYVASAEDIIIAKLAWAAASGSERQLRDIAGILAVKRDALDRAYIERWVTELGLTSMWQQAQRIMQ